MKTLVKQGIGVIFGLSMMTLCVSSFGAAPPGNMGGMGEEPQGPKAEEYGVEQAIEFGRKLYHETAACYACHGAKGEGGVGPALNVEAPAPSEILYQMETNPKMGGVINTMQPLGSAHIFALSMYIRTLTGEKTSGRQFQELVANANASLGGRVAVMTFELTPYEEKVAAVETWDGVVKNWQRRAKTGSLKHDYQLKVLETFEAGKPKFTPQPGKTYWYENAGISNVVLGALKGKIGADSTYVVVGDADSKEVIASYKLPRNLRGDVHTTVMTPDGKYVYIIGAKRDGGEEVATGGNLLSPASLLKVDALSLQPIASYDMGGRLHHGQIFQDKYLLLDTFARDPDGLDIFLLDPETDQIVGGVRDEDLGGFTYTAWTDHEFIYVLMAPAGYGGGPSGGGFLGGMEYIQGNFTTMRPFWVAKIDPKTWEVVREYPYPGFRGDWVTIDAAKEHMYVTAGASSLVSKIRLDTGEVVWGAATGPGPYGLALTADEKEVWVADKGEMAGFYGRTVTVVDAQKGRHIETLFSGYQVDHILLSPNGKEMWATSNGEGRIYVFDVASRQQLKVIDMPEQGDPHGLVFVHYDDNGVSRVVRDQGNFHNGVNPYLGKALE